MIFDVIGQHTASPVFLLYFSGDKTSADVLQKISSRPGAIWLTGPTALDPTASQDIATVLRTSGQAALDKTVPVYQLYAIPYRDACSGYSKNGFATSNAYLEWVNKILVSLKTGAVFSVEPDAIAQSIGKTCLSSQQVSQRYATLRATVEKLQVEPKVLATYLDAGHSEWFADPKTLVAPLLASGIKMADGVAVNVSFFVATPDITSWSQRLVADLGGNKGVIIDTSRNGNGVPPRSAVGEARWCNPANRALGIAPTTSTGRDKIDAFYYAKTIGESDGACFGHAPAGTFELNSALELARNSHV